MRIDVIKRDENNLGIELSLQTLTTETHSDIQFLELEAEIKEALKLTATNIIARIKQEINLRGRKF